MRCLKNKIVLHQQSIHHKDTKIQNTVLKDAVDHSECSLCAAKICTTHLVYLGLFCLGLLQNKMHCESSGS